MRLRKKTHYPMQLSSNSLATLNVVVQDVLCKALMPQLPVLGTCEMLFTLVSTISIT